MRDRERPKRFLGSRCGSASHRPKNGDDCSTQKLLCFERDREREREKETKLGGWYVLVLCFNVYMYVCISMCR